MSNDNGNRGLSLNIRNSLLQKVSLVLIATLTSWMLPGAWHLLANQRRFAMSLMAVYLLVPALVSYWLEVPSFGVILALFSTILACRITASLHAVRCVFGSNGPSPLKQGAVGLHSASLMLLLMSYVVWELAPMPFSIVHVRSRAMEPTIQKGESIVVRNRNFPWSPQLKIGDIVVFRRDSANYDDIKRISATVSARVSPEVPDAYEVTGDNKDASYDSRTFGALPENTISATALYIVWSPEQTRVGKQLLIR